VLAAEPARAFGDALGHVHQPQLNGRIRIFYSLKGKIGVKTMKGKYYFALFIALMVMLPLARAGTKEDLLRLQTDVNALRDQIRELEKTFSSRVDGLKSLLEQLNDQVAQSNLVLDRISKTLETQASGASSSDQMLLEEIRTLSQKMDDTATRVSAMAQQLSELKVQSNTLRQTGAFGSSLAPNDLFDQAEEDFVEGNVDLAIQGFTAYLNNYPGGDMAAAALSRIGDAYTHQNMLPQAVTAFTRVINDYPDSDKVAGALWKRANVQLSMGESDSAIGDLKKIVTDFPDSSESDLAKGKLKELGVRIPRPAKNARR
jgi:TolA-binding protein